MTFHFLDKDTVKKIPTTVFRPKLEYAEVVWWPYRRKQIKSKKKKNIENSHKDVTRTERPAK